MYSDTTKTRHALHLIVSKRLRGSVVVVVIVLLLEDHEIDEERCGKQRRLEFDVEVDGESNGEVVGLGEVLLNETRPQLAHCADLTAVGGEDLEKVCKERWIGVTTVNSMSPQHLLCLQQHGPSIVNTRCCCSLRISKLCEHMPHI